MIRKMSTKILKITIQEKVLIVFDNVIPDMINNKKLNPIVTELFIEAENLISLLSLLPNLVLKCQKMLD